MVYSVGYMCVSGLNFQEFQEYKPALLYKYWLLMKGMVENYCPEVKLNLGLLFTEARRAEVKAKVEFYRGYNNLLPFPE